MKKYLLTIFLSLPFLMAGPLETALSTLPWSLSGSGVKNISHLTPEKSPVEMQEFLAEEDEEREEEESLHHSFTPASLTLSCCTWLRKSCRVIQYNSFTPSLLLSHSHPFNKAPPV